jgi:hypothetical protein
MHTYSYYVYERIMFNMRADTSRLFDFSLELNPRLEFALRKRAIGSSLNTVENLTDIPRIFA